MPSSSDSYIGLTQEAATSKATEKGLRCRVVRKDGKSMRVTKDYRPERLNFAIERGKVVRVSKG